MHSGFMIILLHSAATCYIFSSISISLCIVSCNSSGYFSHFSSLSLYIEPSVILRILEEQTHKKDHFPGWLVCHMKLGLELDRLSLYIKGLLLGIERVRPK